MQKDLKSTIYDLETSLLRPEVRLSKDKLNVLLADDFMEFGSSGGIYEKNEILERLPKNSQTSPVEFSVSDFEVKKLDENIVLATFKTDKELTDKSHVISLRSSIWRKAGDSWQMVFHQGTPEKLK